MEGSGWVGRAIQMLHLPNRWPGAAVPNLPRSSRSAERKRPDDRALDRGEDRDRRAAEGAGSRGPLPAAKEIRVEAVRSLLRPNYWSPRPVTRLDLAVGAFDEIPSVDVPGLPQALLQALPGLVEHRCNIGERGGFVQRLQRGTYAPHIIEHVALELQATIGHEVGFGRSRAGLVPGSYTVVFEHRHPAVGRRAGELAVGIVQAAFDGALPAGPAIRAAVRALQRASDEAVPDLPSIDIDCAVLGGSRMRGAAVLALSRRGHPPPGVLGIAPLQLLDEGLPFSRARVAVIADLDFDDLPAQYRDADRTLRLATVLIDGAPPGGPVVIPAAHQELEESVRGAGRIPALFSLAAPQPQADAPSAGIRAGRIVLRDRFGELDGGELLEDAPAAPQVAATLATRLMGREFPVSGRAE